MNPIADTLNQAIRCHQAGELAHAERLYRQILAAEPRHADALHLLGLIALQAGHREEGLALVRESLRVNPRHAEAHHNLAIALEQQGDLPGSIASWREAIRCRPGNVDALCQLAGALKRQGNISGAATAYSQALAVNPDHPEALNSLANLLQQQGDLASAAPLYQRLLRIEPDHLAALNNLGFSLVALGKPQEAVALLEHAARVKPDYASAHNNLGNARLELGQRDLAVASYRRAIEVDPNFAVAHNNLGKALLDKGQVDEAAAWIDRALRLQPDFVEAHNILGSILLERGDFDGAAASFRRVLELNPRHAAAHSNRGKICAMRDQLDDAAAALELALQLQPDFAEAFSNLGLVRQEQGRVAEAIRTLEHAVQLKPSHAEAHKNLGIALLLAGELERGWAEYEWRQQADRNSVAQFPQPLWDGGPLAGRTILLHTEQGFGDTLQFIRYAPLVRQHGGRVIVSCQPRLLPLLARCRGIDQLVAQGQPLPAFDLHAPLMSLPRIFGTTLQTIPAEVPYVWADPQRIEHWQRVFQAQAGCKIGIAWQGNPAYRRDRHRSIALAHFAPLAALPGVRLISLQKGPAAQPATAAGHPFPVMELGEHFDEAAGAFQDTAAVMQSLDLVITSDTVIAHLAGALGVRVWVAIPYAPDWRWLLEREDSPWYPSMRLFRQTERRTWPEVFERMAEEVR